MNYYKAIARSSAAQLVALAAMALLVGCNAPAQMPLQGYIEGEFVLLASPYAGQLQKLHARRGGWPCR